LAQWKLNIKIIGAQQAMQAVLSKSKGFAVSDVLFKEEAGASAWIIKDMRADLCIIRQWHTPGHPTDHSSFWSKLAGILGVLYTLTFWPPSTVKPTF